MRLGITLILLMANLGFGCLIIILNYQSRQTEKNLYPSTGINVHQFEAIEEIDIHSSLLQSARSLEKIDREWFITSPIQWPANPFAIQRILSQLEFLERDVSFSLSDVIAAGQTLADYGLQNPILTIDLKTNEDHWVLQLGDPQPQENRLYLLNADQSYILAISRDLLHDLLLEIEDLRSPQLFTIPTFEVQGLAVQINQPNTSKFRLAKVQDHWLFETPIQTPANDKAVMALIAQLSALPVIHFVDQDKQSDAVTGLDNPSIRVTIEGFHRRETLLIGHRLTQAGQVAQYYAMLENSTTVFTLPAEPIDLLKKAQEVLRKREFMNLSPSTLTAIEISSPDQSLRLDHLETGSWQIKDLYEKSKPADEVTVEDILTKLENLEAMAFVSDAPSLVDLETWGLNKPQRTIELKSNVTQTLLIGKARPDGLLYAKLAQAPYVYAIDSRILDDIPLSVIHYRSRWIELVAPTTPIESIRIQDLLTQKYILDYTFSPTEEPVNETEARTTETILCDNLHKFRVKDFLDIPFKADNSLGPKTPMTWRYKLEAKTPLTGEHAEATITLYFTERLDGSLQMGGLPSLNTTFTLTQNWIDALENSVRPLPKPTPLH